MRLGMGASPDDFAAIPTGSLSLDAALGIGGIPRGRLTEIYGPAASGKTTLAMHMLAAAQKNGGIAAVIDAEHALDISYVKALGVDIGTLLVSQPDTGEQALGIVELLVRSGALDIIVIDSVAALVPQAELNSEMGEAPIGRQARLMSQGLRKLTALVSKAQTSVVFINQLRQKIGVTSGSSETTTGGNALKFYASVRLEVQCVTTLKRDKTPIGNRTRIRVVKNKLAPPFRQAEFDVIYGRGIAGDGELVALAVAQGVIKKDGRWFTYGESRLGQGQQQMAAFLRATPEIRATLERHVRQNLGLRCS